MTLLGSQVKVPGGGLGCRVLSKGFISFFWILQEGRLGVVYLYLIRVRLSMNKTHWGKGVSVLYQHGHALGTSSDRVPACRTCST